MTAAFADSSALVKLYADEAGAEIVRAHPLLVISQLARVEVPAALWRKHRMRELSAADARLLELAFEADYFGTGDEPARFLVVAATAPVLEEAAGLVSLHGLRAYDGVQLACARATQRQLSEAMSFVAFDASLREAAAAEGLVLVPEFS